MERMSLGSPNASPNQSQQYMPSFLLGDDDIVAAPRFNTLSPNATGVRKMSLSPNPFNANNSYLGSTPPNHFPPNSARHNGTISKFASQGTVGGGFTAANYVSSGSSHYVGPPTQGLFDKLRSETNKPMTPLHSSFLQHSVLADTSRLNKSAQPNEMSEPWFHTAAADLAKPIDAPDKTEFWVTVFGFPMSHVDTVLDHIQAVIGKINGKELPSVQNSNYVHVRFASRMDAYTAVRMSGDIEMDNVIIGIVRCKDPQVVERSEMEKENSNPALNESAIVSPPRRKIRSLAYDLGRDPILKPEPSSSSTISTLMDKAADLLFNW